MNVAADHPASWPIDRLLADCTGRRLRRSGPGGQRRNKVETGAGLVHLPSGIRAEASERRNHEENRKVAVFRLRVKLALGIRAPLRSHTSQLWQTRCSLGKIAINPGHDDFPAILAEALDAIEHHGGDVKAASATLNCTTSQVVRLLRLEPAALQQVNQTRSHKGMRVLR